MPEASTIRDYTIVMAVSSPQLVDEVQAMIALGWEPVGGPFFDPDSFLTTRYQQAMILRVRS